MYHSLIQSLNRSLIYSLNHSLAHLDWDWDGWKWHVMVWQDVRKFDFDEQKYRTDSKALKSARRRRKRRRARSVSPGREFEALKRVDLNEEDIASMRTRNRMFRERPWREGSSTASAASRNEIGERSPEASNLSIPVDQTGSETPSPSFSTPRACANQEKSKRRSGGRSRFRSPTLQGLEADALSAVMSKRYIGFPFCWLGTSITLAKVSSLTHPLSLAHAFGFLSPNPFCTVH